MRELSNLLPTADTLTRQNDSSSALTLDDVGCDYCCDAGFVKGNIEELRDGEWRSRAIPCPKCKPTPESIGIPQKLAGATFANFDIDLNPGMNPALDRCQAVADQAQWCALLVGPPGLGKSHLAVAALKERFGYYWEAGALLRNIRELSFGEGARHAEEDVLAGWQDGRFLLVVDDLGAEKQTDWAKGTLYAILNARYSQELPTIITTNNPDAIDDRILSRYAVGAVTCKGKDLRRR